MGHDVESDYEVCGSVVFFLFFFLTAKMDWQTNLMLF